MSKRILVALIIGSMMLHSASRLGVLTYLYQQRHEIAFSLGLLPEVPIAMCNSDYDGHLGLEIVAHDEHESTVPPSAFQAREITLYLHFTREPKMVDRAVLYDTRQSPPADASYASPPLSVFHPPA